jgi:CheY-like chemotaxis protein
MMARLVQKCGHDGVYATSGPDALSFVRSHAVGLVVLDNMMPDMDGIQVLRRLRADPATATLPVVMWSAVADPWFVEHARREGATDYWVKAAFDYLDLPALLNGLLTAGCH